VRIRDYRQNSSKWIPGVIEKLCGDLLYLVRVTVDSMTTVWKQHFDQILSREEKEEMKDNEASESSRHLKPPEIVPSAEFTMIGPSLPSVTVSDSNPSVPHSSDPTPNPPRTTHEVPISTSLAESNTALDARTVTESAKTGFTSHGRKITVPNKFKDFVIKL
jgi:hypothetical protein